MEFLKKCNNFQKSFYIKNPIDKLHCASIVTDEFFFSSRYLDRIIRGPELHEFAAMLMPHQKATTADGGYSY